MKTGSNNKYHCPYCNSDFIKAVVWDGEIWAPSLLCSYLHSGILFSTTLDRVTYLDDYDNIEKISEYKGMKIRYRILDAGGKEMQIPEEFILWG
jgi:hypothetical protein